VTTNQRRSLIKRFSKLLSVKRIKPTILKRGSRNKLLKKIGKTKLWATTVNIFLIVIIINVIANLFSLNIDLTANKIHSLSPTSKEIVANLDDIVTIKVFISDNLPPQLSPAKESLANILRQYQKANRSKIKIKYLDPLKDDSARNEAVSLGITPMQFSSLKQDQFQIVQGYFGLAIFYAGEREVISALQEINNLEYHLTAAIKKLQQEKIPRIAFSSGLGETSQTQLSKIKKLLRLNYQVSMTDLSEEGARYDDQTETLVIAGPEEKLSEKAKLVIDQLLMNQKGVILLLDKVSIGGGLIATPIDNDLDEFLDHYGITVNKDLIADQSAAFASFQTETGRFIIPYPLWVQTRKENANQDLPLTSSLEGVVFPWASSLKIKDGVQPLWQSTTKTQRLTDFENIAPNRQWNFEDGEQFVLAALQTNGQESFFKEKKPENLEEMGISEFKEGSEAVKLAVVGDANFIEDQTLGPYPENAQFFLNLVDYLTQDTQLIKIRGKTVFSRPLKMIEEKEKQTIKIISLAVSPAVLLLLALLIRWQRKKTNQSLLA